MAQKIKSTYGGSFAKMVAGDYKPSRTTLIKLGTLIVDCVVAEARKDMAKEARRKTGDPVGLPQSERFLSSFTSKLYGQSTVEIYSTWPTIEQLTEGTDPYPMTWLTRPNGVNAVPMKDSMGRLIIRATPLSTQDAWIHPGFARHNFLQRGMTRAKKEMADIVREDLKQFLAGTRK
mgnify:FL=1